MGSPSGDISQGTIRKMEKGVGGLTESSKEQHFTVVLLDNTHRNAYVSCSPILKLPPLYHTACLLLLTKSLTSCTSRNINLSKTIQRTAMTVPTRTQESEDLAPHNTPCQKEAVKRPMLCPNSQSSAPTPFIIKEKMG
jgi:hypothetical protein